MFVPSDLSGYDTIISLITIAVGMIPDKIHSILSLTSKNRLCSVLILEVQNFEMLVSVL